MLWIILLVLIIFADQLSKWLVVALLQGKESVYVIPGVLRFTYVENDGAAFGMLDDHRWVFLVLSTVMIIALIFYIVKYKPSSKWVMTSLILIVGGGIGNMIDRIRLGYVVDFFKTEFMDFAVFNVADCFITVGAVLLGVYVIFFEPKVEKRLKAEKEAQALATVQTTDTSVTEEVTEAPKEEENPSSGENSENE